MKKSAIILSFLSVCFVSAFAFAEEPQLMDSHKDGKKMGMGMHPQSSMVATPDGGVIVLSGNHLSKFDANLNLLKEAEVKGGPAPDKDKDNSQAWKERPEMPAVVPDAEPKRMTDQEIADTLAQAGGQPPAEPAQEAPAEAKEAAVEPAPAAQ